MREDKLSIQSIDFAIDIYVEYILTEYEKLI